MEEGLPPPRVPPHMPMPAPGSYSMLETRTILRNLLVILVVYLSCLLIITYLYCIRRRERGQDDHQVSPHGWGNFGILSRAHVTRTVVQVEAVADIMVYGSQGKKPVNDDCVICLASFEDGEECKVLRDCGHVYHKECIDEWIWRDGHCPLCRVYARVVRSVGHDLEFGVLPFP